MKTFSHNFLLITGLVFFIFISHNSYSQEIPWWKDWQKYENNPIMQVTVPQIWFNSAGSPNVLHEEGVFKMWFQGSRPDGIKQWGYAESVDGLNWEINEEPVGPMPQYGAWDCYKAPGNVIRADDTLRMWYTACDMNFSTYAIGYAWAAEEDTWNFHANPVIERGEPLSWDHGFGPVASFVYFDGLTYHMYYMATDVIGHATSSDGINWEKDYENSPVINLGPPGSWYDRRVMGGPIIKIGDTLNLFFWGHDGTYGNNCQGMERTGRAWSLDYINWTIGNDGEPVLDLGELGSWDSHCVDAHTVLFHENRFKMWYSGIYESTWEIGYSETDEMPAYCLADGITFSLQSQIDDFPHVYPWCSEITGNVEITGNNITDLNGLSNLQLIDGDLDIYDCEALESLSGLDSVNSINGDLLVTSNNLLIDFTGLENLTYVGENLRITANQSLTSLTGLENIASESIEDLTIAVNSSLSYCHINSICYYLLSPNGSVRIQDNAPGCNDSTTVRQSCAHPVSVNEPETALDLNIYPNPFSVSTIIEYELEKQGSVELTIYNHLGNQIQVIVDKNLNSGIHEIKWNAERLPAGIYYCILKTGVGMKTVRMIKLD